MSTELRNRWECAGDRWVGDESWAVEIDYDEFEVSAPFVVAVFVADGEYPPGVLATPSPAEARAMAAALVEAAARADRANERNRSVR